MFATQIAISEEGMPRITDNLLKKGFAVMAGAFIRKGVFSEVAERGDDVHIITFVGGKEEIGRLEKAGLALYGY